MGGGYFFDFSDHTEYRLYPNGTCPIRYKDYPIQNFRAFLDGKSGTGWYRHNFFSRKPSPSRSQSFHMVYVHEPGIWGQVRIRIQSQC
ncbi:hypothetical protein K443DRAFT_680708 [Laccaria amethystina LaAM-08-1]|uniref:Uncharacterized protein n=1 Tax=Laccaria amethystina LaAM-08-1 TaxID=1095629 RepID=A0A0C9X086_9AGAR|nr:hypothetical protein K443DRAFT_680708 [Laccaria amethystina LaAM-08-1]